MALITCPECQAQISDRATACPRCGAPIAGPMVNAMPVVTVKPPRTVWWYWWLWGPLGLVAALLAFGALIPEQTADANAFARVCRELYSSGQIYSLYTCDKIEGELRTGARRLQGPDRDTAAAMEALRAQTPEPLAPSVSSEPTPAPVRKSAKQARRPKPLPAPDDPNAAPFESNQEVSNPYRQ
jgi:hypothetical protein